jgi:hypothetical protein
MIEQEFLAGEKRNMMSDDGCRLMLTQVTELPEKMCDFPAV